MCSHMSTPALWVWSEPPRPQQTPTFLLTAAATAATIRTPSRLRPPNGTDLDPVGTLHDQEGPAGPNLRRDRIALHQSRGAGVLSATIREFRPTRRRGACNPLGAGQC